MTSAIHIALVPITTTVTTATNTQQRTLPARHCAEHFAFHPPNNPMRWVLSLSVCYKWWSRGRERVTEVVTGTGWNHTVWAQGPVSHHSCAWLMFASCLFLRPWPLLWGPDSDIQWLTGQTPPHSRYFQGGVISSIRLVLPGVPAC